MKLILETQDSCANVNNNAQCKHCSEDYTIESKNNVDWNDIVEQFSKLDSLGQIIIKNGAGALGDTEISILERALEEELSVSLTTEGTYVPASFESRFLGLAGRYSGNIGVTVSLDGHSSEIYGILRNQNDFDAAVKFIRRMVGKLPVAVNYVVHAGNVEHIPNYTDFVVHELKLDRVNFLELSPVRNATDNSITVADAQTYFNILMRTYEQGDEAIKIALANSYAKALHEGQRCRGCEAGRIIFINSLGNIYPCTRLGIDKYLAGNIAELTLGEAFSSVKFENARTASLSNDIFNVTCPGRVELMGKSAKDLTQIATDWIKLHGVKDAYPIAKCFSPAY